MSGKSIRTGGVDDRPVRLAFAEAFQEEPFDALEHAGRYFPELGVMWRQLQGGIDQHAAFAFAIGEGPVEDFGKECAHSFAWWQPTAALDPLDDVNFHVSLERALEQFALVAEGVVETGSGEARCIRKPRHRRGREAVAPETMDRGVKDRRFVKFPGPRHPSPHLVVRRADYSLCHYRMNIIKRVILTRCEARMIRFYFHPTPNPAKVALLLEEARLPYELVPVDTSKGEQHRPEFREINPNGKVPAIIDTQGPDGRQTRVFDSTAILLYLAEKIDAFMGSKSDRPELLSWLMFIASGLGPFSGQSVHFQFAAPEGLDYARNRYRREAERHYQVLNDHLADREYIVGNNYTIADMSAWGWLERAPRVMKGAEDPLGAFPHLKRLFQTVDSRPAAARARAVGKDHEFKKVNDEETKRALFPSNYPLEAK